MGRTGTGVNARDRAITDHAREIFTKRISQGIMPKGEGGKDAKAESEAEWAFMAASTFYIMKEAWEQTPDPPPEDEDEDTG